ncbi:unnamed protein product [Vitrella brassicaformis CCMP3155]|uniref:non-specific serine/threonine protein kinase n=1 Tax=Vitrella brassicaformis (strain CCMP3155) TaxID=1169540 RepID=A0A0G4ECG1_VITBC|nr:unnamed protein product [Vitrella brassicaformis CCMP3155]|eukprot:CEL93409.1 unnamed protein product [Vitrella brassicaformis CCMP3155]
MSKLEDFKEIALVGEGAYSSVYKVLRLSDGQEYALKKVTLPKLSEKEKQNALNEVRLLASISIVTEFADGGDLFQKIVQHQKAKQYFREADIWKIFIGMCQGLKALHDLNILHRDLKSANVFLTKARAVKIGDFNVSKVAKRGLLYTQTGTPYYASPEVWRDQPYDAKSDVWSLGCVLYEMCALKPPFRADDMEALYRKVLKGQYSKLPHIFSSDIPTLLDLCLQTNAIHRPSVTQILTHPTIIRQKERLAASTETSPTPPETSDGLLNTIKLPKDVAALTAHLPKPNYGSPTKKGEGSRLRQARTTDQQGGERSVLKAKREGGALVEYHDKRNPGSAHGPLLEGHSQLVDIHGEPSQLSPAPPRRPVAYHRRAPKDMPSRPLVNDSAEDQIYPDDFERENLPSRPQARAGQRRKLSSLAREQRPDGLPVDEPTSAPRRKDDQRRKKNRQEAEHMRNGYPPPVSNNPNNPTPPALPPSLPPVNRPQAAGMPAGPYPPHAHAQLAYQQYKNYVYHSRRNPYGYVIPRLPPVNNMQRYHLGGMQPPGRSESPYDRSESPHGHAMPLLPPLREHHMKEALVYAYRPQGRDAYLAYHDRGRADRQGGGEPKGAAKHVQRLRRGSKDRSVVAPNPYASPLPYLPPPAAPVRDAIIDRRKKEKERERERERLFDGREYGYHHHHHHHHHQHHPHYPPAQYYHHL